VDTTRIERALGTAVRATTELDGGMIGTVHRVALADGRTVVAKTGETPLTVEARMLRHLDARDLPVPAVLYASDDLLVLSYVDGESRMTPAVARDAAEKLAALHDTTAEGFGFPVDTLTGTVTQPNPWTDRWSRFYVEHRLEHVRNLCLDDGALGTDLDRRLTATLDRLDELLVEPAEPALIHGDVWETNLLTDGNRVLSFLDPACYYAHPEIELAYIDWTDTFGEPFFERYDAVRGIEQGFFETRRYAYRLYPLLVHLLLFGDLYGEELGETLEHLPG
jgi:fructosamine-3-kinase